MTAYETLSPGEALRRARSLAGPLTITHDGPDVIIRHGGMHGLGAAPPPPPPPSSAASPSLSSMTGALNATLVQALKPIKIPIGMIPNPPNYPTFTEDLKGAQPFNALVKMFTLTNPLVQFVTESVNEANAIDGNKVRQLTLSTGEKINFQMGLGANIPAGMNAASKLLLSTAELITNWMVLGTQVPGTLAQGIATAMKKSGAAGVEAAKSFLQGAVEMKLPLAGLGALPLSAPNEVKALLTALISQIKSKFPDPYNTAKAAWDAAQAEIARLAAEAAEKARQAAAAATAAAQQAAQQAAAAAAAAAQAAADKAARLRRALIDWAKTQPFGQETYVVQVENPFAFRLFRGPGLYDGNGNLRSTPGSGISWYNGDNPGNPSSWTGPATNKDPVTGSTTHPETRTQRKTLSDEQWFQLAMQNSPPSALDLGISGFRGLGFVGTALDFGLNGATMVGVWALIFCIVTGNTSAPLIGQWISMVKAQVGMPPTGQTAPGGPPPSYDGQQAGGYAGPASALGAIHAANETLAAALKASGFPVSVIPNPPYYKSFQSDLKTRPVDALVNLLAPIENLFNDAITAANNISKVYERRIPLPGGDLVYKMGLDVQPGLSATDGEYMRRLKMVTNFMILGVQDLPSLSQGFASSLLTASQRGVDGLGVAAAMVQQIVSENMLVGKGGPAAVRAKAVKAFLVAMQQKLPPIPGMPSGLGYLGEGATVSVAAIVAAVTAASGALSAICALASAVMSSPVLAQLVTMLQGIVNDVTGKGGEEPPPADESQPPPEEEQKKKSSIMPWLLGAGAIVALPVAGPVVAVALGAGALATLIKKKPADAPPPTTPPPASGGREGKKQRGPTAEEIKALTAAGMSAAQIATMFASSSDSSSSSGSSSSGSDSTKQPPAEDPAVETAPTTIEGLGAIMRLPVSTPKRPARPVIAAAAAKQVDLAKAHASNAAALHAVAAKAENHATKVHKAAAVVVEKAVKNPALRPAAVAAKKEAQAAAKVADARHAVARKATQAAQHAQVNASALQRRVAEYDATTEDWLRHYQF